MRCIRIDLLLQFPSSSQTQNWCHTECVSEALVAFGRLYLFLLYLSANKSEPHEKKISDVTNDISLILEQNIGFPSLQGNLTSRPQENEPMMRLNTTIIVTLWAHISLVPKMYHDEILLHFVPWRWPYRIVQLYDTCIGYETMQCLGSFRPVSYTARIVSCRNAYRIGHEIRVACQIWVYGANASVTNNNIR